MKNSINKKLAHILKVKREEKNQTLTEVAKSIGKSPKSVQLYENGEIIISIEMLVKFCEHYDLDLYETLKSVL